MHRLPAMRWRVFGRHRIAGGTHTPRMCKKVLSVKKARRRGFALRDASDCQTNAEHVRHRTTVPQRLLTHVIPVLFPQQSALVVHASNSLAHAGGFG